MNYTEMVEEIRGWEQHLMKLPPQQSDQEFGRVRAELAQIGERIARRISASLQSRCHCCNKPLSGRGPYDTIPKPAPDTSLGWINQFACSPTCAEKLRTEMHDREMARQANA